jgi:chromosome segregation ATPase
LERQTKSVAREKEAQVKLLQRSDVRVKEEIDLKTEQEKLAVELGLEVKEYIDEVRQLRKVVNSLERDRERLVNELSDQRQEHSRGEDEVKMKAMQISELHKTIADWEIRLKQQQQLYERARSERAHYSKSLLESQDQIAEMRERTKILSLQLDQFKEDVQKKEKAMVREHFECQVKDTMIGLDDDNE